LIAKQAKLILDQLAGEALFASPTADDLVASVVHGDGGLASLLFNGTALDPAFTLPDEQRRVIAGHLATITDRIEAGVARLWQAVALDRAGLAGHIASRERKRADEADAALRQSKMAAEVEAEVNARLTELAARRPAASASPPVIPLKPATAPGDVASSSLLQHLHLARPHRPLQFRMVGLRLIGIGEGKTAHCVIEMRVAAQVTADGPCVAGLGVAARQRPAAARSIDL
jgi:hypothetical protein